jgi:hypothetical protein
VQAWTTTMTKMPLVSKKNKNRDSLRRARSAYFLLL